MVTITICNNISVIIHRVAMLLGATKGMQLMLVNNIIVVTIKQQVAMHQGFSKGNIILVWHLGVVSSGETLLSFHVSSRL
jgi:hypothetical protein